MLDQEQTPHAPEAIEEAIPEALLPENAAAPKSVTVADIHFRNNSKVYFFDPAGLQVSVGDHVIVETARGIESGEVVLRNGERLPVSRSCQQSAILALARAELEG